MKKLVLSALAAAALIPAVSCQSNKTTTTAVETETWRDVLAAQLPLLGHRNWIVITDMAYPLQSAGGITTLYADEPYADVLAGVKEQIDAAPHVFAHIWTDREQQFLSEDIAPGIDALRKDMQTICGTEAQAMPHEDLIKRLDEAGKLYQVLIIKTPLTIPYTTTFFELDCGYWSADRQQTLDARIQAE